ncbi:hypothetical protein [Azospirillum halopraeferens]|uniref:hypothetical protein n=1 Tax=Azospirillum halopraeferens TaxID=34010 RepID=UPI000429C1CB|nr:hypothetical protein [Azospirillum halopraeferens]
MRAPTKLPVSEAGYNAAFKLAQLAEEAFRGLTAAQAMEAIAIHAGACAFQNAAPGKSAEVLAVLQMMIAQVHDGCCRGAGVPAGPAAGNA